jgi:hypothetical protein
MVATSEKVKSIGTCPALVEFGKKLDSASFEIKSQKEAITIIHQNLILDPVLFRFKLDKIRMENSESKRQKIEYELKIERQKRKIIETINNSKFDSIMSELAVQFEDICYNCSKPELTINEFKGIVIGPEILGYDFKRIVKIFQNRSSQLDERHFDDISLFTSETECFYRRLVCFYFVIMSLNLYKKDINSARLSLYVNQFFINYGQELKLLIYEFSRYPHDSAKIAMQNLFAISEVPRLEESINSIKTLSDLDYDNLTDSSNHFFEFLNLRYRTLQKSINQKETEEQFLNEFLLSLNKFVFEHDCPNIKVESKISQDRIDTLSDLSYWELQQLKNSEENPEMISIYNHRLVNLVDEGVADAINFVAQNSKIIELYKNKDYKKLLIALKTKFEIPFITGDEINPNGQRVLDGLGKVDIQTKPKQNEIEEKKIKVFIKSKWAKIIESYDDVNRKIMYDDCKKYISLIEKHNGVPAFVQQIKSESELDSYNHKGSNKNGIDLSNAWIFRIGPNGGRIAFDLETSEVVYVGMHYKD